MTASEHDGKKLIISAISGFRPSWICSGKIEGIPDHMPLCEGCCQICENPHIAKEYWKRHRSMELRELILKAMDNQDVPRSTSETMILGALDSIGLVNFVMDLEDELAEQGYSIKLVSDKAFGQNSPFATVDTLLKYIEDIIEWKRLSLSVDHLPV